MIYVGILTYKAKSMGRLGMLAETISSARQAFPGSHIAVYDNGSDEDDFQAVMSLTRPDEDVLLSGSADHTPGRGVGAVASYLTRTMGRPALDSGLATYGVKLVGRIDRAKGDDIIVCSDDDMRWRPEAGEVLTSFWSAAPPNVAILGGYLEPQWAWNTPRYLVAGGGGVRALVRDTTPAAAWTFPASHVDMILPLERSWEFDTRACVRLNLLGKVVAQVDLAEHLGAERSTQGNQAGKIAQPLDRKKWGI